jgi:pimeloyl-[acyl-carrier protein] synthase
MSISTSSERELSLLQLLDDEVLANPYPLYHHLRSYEPVHWDPFLHAWVVTRYSDALTVLETFSAQCAPTREKLAAIGLDELNAAADVMLRQMLFMDPPTHTSPRRLCARVFSSHKADALRPRIRQMAETLLDVVKPKAHMDVIGDFANPLTTTINAEMMGIGGADIVQLKRWSVDFGEILGNFQYNPDRIRPIMKSLEEMVLFFRTAVQQGRKPSREGLLDSLLAAEQSVHVLTHDVMIANCIITMVGGQETTPNLIGNGLLTLLRNPEQLQKLRSNPSLIPSAIEEMLRYESPSQHTTRIAPQNVRLGGKLIHKGQAVIVVIGAANRDPERFAEPDTFDITREENRHLAFGGGNHFCFGAPLARIEGQIAFEVLLEELSNIELQPIPLVWRNNTGLRGLNSLPISFSLAGWEGAKISHAEPEISA